MKKIQLFFQVLAKSIADPPAYKEFLQQSFWFSFKYFLVLCFFLGLIFSINIFVSVIPSLQQFANTIRTEATRIYPAGLEIQVQDGTLSTNQEEPIIFPMDRENREEFENMLIIDTAASVDDIDTYDTAVLVTDTNIAARGSNRTEVYPLADVEEFQLDKQTFDETISKFLPMLNILVPIIATAMFFFGLVGIFLMNIIRILLFSLITWVISAIMKLSYPYGKIFQFTIHAATAVILLQTFLGYMGIGIPFPFFYTILYTIFAILVLTKLKEDSPTETTLTTEQESKTSSSPSKKKTKK